MSNPSKEKTILFIEAFYGGSHKQLIDLLIHNFGKRCDIFYMNDKKWHWRMRTGSLHFATTIPQKHSYRYLFTSANLNLAELIGLRPDLQGLKKILYFHENQLVYPVRKQQDRDFQYGYNQIVSCLAADVVLFNSTFNMESFLTSQKPYLNLMPDYKPGDNILLKIKPKCHVLYFPISFPEVSFRQADVDDSTEKPLHIVWAHRWEHDKNPDTFFEILYKLKDEQLNFKISVMGQGYADVPGVFAKAEADFKDRIISWGYQETKGNFLKCLSCADVAVSTALHEFFGVSMLEAVSCGCYPLCPKRLVYPEIFPDEYLYSTTNQLLKKLRQFCKRPDIARKHAVKVDLEKYSWDRLRRNYEELFEE